MNLKKKDNQSLKEFKNRVIEEFPGARFILFGSKATGRDEEFSDIDILVMLNKKVTIEIEKRIFGIGFEIGLKMEVVFGIIVEESKFWNSSLAKAMPFYQNVVKQGVAI